MDSLGGDVLNFGFGVDAVGYNAGLCAGHGDGGHIQGVQGDGGQGDGGLLAGCQQHVHLALARQRHEILGHLDEVVRDSAHGGNDDDNLVARGPTAGDASGNILDAICVSYRRAAVFLND